MKNWIIGMDISTLSEVESCGGRFFDNGEEYDAITILQNYGMNLVRLRLWNDPYAPNGTPYGAGTNDLACTVQVAKRVKAKGLSWLLDFHYSDFWTDPGKQTMPKAWKDFTAEQVEEAVYDYTASVLNRLKQEGVLPEVVAVGNEITNGLLWPYAHTSHFDRVIRVLNAGIRAVRKTSPNIKVMLHLDNGGNNELYRNWFDRYLNGGGADFDYIGLSYYPFWHGSMDDLRSNMEDLAVRYQKDLIVAEVSMGFTLEDYGEYEKLAPDQRKGMAANARLAERVPYPMTRKGQQDFMYDLMKMIHQLPDGRGRGFIYWEPAWLPVPGSGWANEAALAYTGEKGPGGNEWANQALFDYEGNALPALQTIRDFGKSNECI